jgi:hypothetical protein
MSEQTTFVSNENVRATIISHHVIAPERSPRSGNVASTRWTNDQDGPDQARQHPSSYLELLAIAYTSESPNSTRLDGKRDVLQVTLLSSVQTVKNVRAQAELNKTKTQREPTKQTTTDELTTVSHLAKIWFLQ